MNQRELLTDVNLSELALNGNGPDVSLTFLSMKDGHQVARILCHGLLVMNCVCSAARKNPVTENSRLGIYLV